MSVELGCRSDQLGAHCLQLVGVAGLHFRDFVVGALAIFSLLLKVLLKGQGLGRGGGEGD